MTAKKHGLSYTVEYRVWQAMVYRCTSPTSPAWEDYGGRGIKVCDRWLTSPQAFVDDMGPRPRGHELDRRDNNQGYSPDNCRWVTRKINDRNRRGNVFLEFRGERLTVAEWCERLGLPQDTVRWRIGRGWSVEKALTTPVRHRGHNGCVALARMSWRDGRKKIDESVVREIRRLKADGARTADIAALFSISRGQVKKIVSGQRWAHVGREEVVAA